MNYEEEDIEAILAGHWRSLWETEDTAAAEADYEMRSVEAVQRGQELRKLQAACSRMGFLGVPLDYYLTEAAHEAGVSLTRILEPLGRQAGNLWVALARAVSLPLAEAQLMARAMFAQSLLPVPAMVRTRQTEGTQSGTSLFNPEATAEDYAVLLDGLEAAYDVPNARHLKELLAALTK